LNEERRKNVEGSITPPSFPVSALFVEGSYHGKRLVVHTDLDGMLPEFVSIDNVLYKQSCSPFKLMGRGPAALDDLSQVYYVMEGHVTPIKPPGKPSR
jgi:hypothetical protein